MIVVVSAAAARIRTVDARRCTSKGHSGGATGPFGGYRSGAAGRLRAVVGLAAAVISLEVEGQAGGTELDDVARLEGLGALDTAPVHLYPVRRSQIPDDPRAARGPDLGVV